MKSVAPGFKKISEMIGKDSSLMHNVKMKKNTRLLKSTKPTKG